MPHATSGRAGQAGGQEPEPRPHVKSRRDPERDALLGEIQDGAYADLLRALQERAVFFRRFRDWGEVLAFMREGRSRDPQKDEVLRPMLMAHSLDRDPRWKVLLLTLFWQGLRALAWRRRRWDPDPAERLQNLVLSFLRSVDAIDVGKRPERLVQKLMNDSSHRLFRQCEAVWRQTNRRFPWGLLDPAVLEASPEQDGSASRQLEELREDATHKYQRLWREGIIGVHGLQVLLHTRVYGEPLQTYARAAGIGYEAAKRRRQRAERVIRRNEASGRIGKGGAAVSEQEPGGGKNTGKAPGGWGRPGRMPECLRPCGPRAPVQCPPPEKVPAVLGGGEEVGHG